MRSPWLVTRAAALGLALLLAACSGQIAGAPRDGGGLPDGGDAGQPPADGALPGDGALPDGPGPDGVLPGDGPLPDGPGPDGPTGDAGGGEGGAPSDAQAGDAGAVEIVCPTPDPAFLGLTNTCNIWGCDARSQNCGDWERAFRDCETGLVLIKNMGVSWTRLGAPWYMVDPLCQPALHADRSRVIARVVKAARDRGLRIVFQIGTAAPACAYGPPDTVSPPTDVSLRLDVKDAELVRGSDLILDLVHPDVCAYELSNEQNWGSEHFRQNPSTGAYEYPTYSSPSGHVYASDRLKQLQVLLGDRVRARDTATHAPLLLSGGISYFWTSAYPTYGWTGFAGLDPAHYITPLVEATAWLQQLAGGWQPAAATFFGDYVDAVSFHPYFTGPETAVTVPHFAAAAAAAAPGKPLWITETGYGNLPPDDSVALAQFQALVAEHDAGRLARILMFDVRDSYRWQSGDPLDPYGYTLYDYDLAPKKPNVIQAMRDVARRVPYDQRFAPPRAGAPVLADLVAGAPAAAWYANSYPPGGHVLAWGDTSQPALGTAGPATTPAEDGVTHAAAFAMSLPAGIDYVQGDSSLAVPATGIPTLRLRVGFDAATAAPARVDFELWVIDGASQAAHVYAKDKTGALETIELDLSLYRGKTVGLTLRAHKLSVAGGGTAGVVWEGVKVIDRGG
ncbi:MAG: hypothetical protein MUC69_00875 [Gemmatimonadales bacterium]|jgi:hypothetical protein|nr:hypothetical protein [Gemmatimonadales bacterium]